MKTLQKTTYRFPHGDISLFNEVESEPTEFDWTPVSTRLIKNILQYNVDYVNAKEVLVHIQQQLKHLI